MDNLLSENIKTLFNNIQDDSELEVMFNNYKKDNILNLHNYIDVLKYIKYRNLNDKLKLELINNLDISYNYDDITFNTYRITIDKLDNINKLINGIENRNNSIIFSLLASKIINKDKDIDIIEKIKDPKKKIDFDEYDIRIRLSEEKSMNVDKIKSLVKLKDVDKKIIYRFNRC